MADPRLIPPGIVDTNAAIYNTLLDRAASLDIAIPIVNLIDRVDPSALPLLMQQFHVDFARPDLPDTQKRALIKGSIPWHKTKGTPGTLTGMAQAISGVTPEIRERNYFLCDHSGSLCDVNAMTDPPRQAFICDCNQLDQDRMYQPGPSKFHFDAVFDKPSSVVAGVSRSDMTELATQLQPARAFATVRFTDFACDDPYSQLDTDLLQI
jgi:hypothetical protein